VIQGQAEQPDASGVQRHNFETSPNPTDRIVGRKQQVI